jgi:hypothetical protein
MGPADPGRLRPVGGPAAWLAPQIDFPAHVHELTQAERDELDAALRAAVLQGWDPARAGTAGFPLHAFAATLQAVRRQLETGSGFCLLRGIPVERYRGRERDILLCGIGAQLGRIMVQNPAGELLNHVRARPGASTRGFETGSALPFHSDSCDIVGLLCLRAAKSGGQSAIASTRAIHDALVHRRPDVLRVLYQPFHIDRHGENSDTPPFYATPVFMYHAGRLFSRFNPGYIYSAQRYRQTPTLTPKQVEAIDMFERLCRSDPFRLDMVLEPGDLQLLNNNCLVHARAPYEDDVEPERNRHLLRIWLSTHHVEEIPAPMRERYLDMERWQANARLSPHVEDGQCG